MSSGGNSEPDKYAQIALSVLNKAFMDTKILILKDMDINSNGTETTNSQREQFLSKSSCNRMLTRREIENYLFDFEIVSKFKPHITKQQYDSVILDIESEVKSKAAELMALCGESQKGKEKFLLNLSLYITPETNVYADLKRCIF